VREEISMQTRKFEQAIVVLSFMVVLAAVLMVSRFLFVLWLGSRAESLGILVGSLAGVAAWTWMTWRGSSSKRAVQRGQAALPATVQEIRCLDCDGDQFFEGASGGLCTNYKCAGCGSKYNVGPGFIERI
jgi:hypothetical protein